MAANAFLSRDRDDPSVAEALARRRPSEQEKGSLGRAIADGYVWGEFASA